MKLTMRDARLEAMRGNLDASVLKKPEPVQEKAPEPVTKEVVKEVPVAAPVTVDTGPIAQAMTDQAQLIAQVIASLKPEQKPGKWTFKITERDRMGNIISFTAEQA